MTANADSLHVRPATIADAASVASLLAELGYAVDVDTMSDRLRAFIGAGEIVLLARIDDEPSGLVSLHITPVLHRPRPVGRITAMVVAERARRRRVGRTLVEEAERLLRAAGCERVEVTSNQRRADAHRFYEAMGYENTSYRFGKVF